MMEEQSALKHLEGQVKNQQDLINAYTKDIERAEGNIAQARKRMAMWQEALDAVRAAQSQPEER